MKLIYMYLKGYKPLSLSDIETFEYTPDKDWQLILGSNGSGKSSILRAASPNVSDKKEFRKDGIKITHWLDADGSVYKLRSDYGNSPKHSFIKCADIDDEGYELNDGNTVTIQTELTETHLRYNKYIHSLLTQQLKFTTMPRGAREDLLLGISGIDFTYALGLFDSLKKSHRDAIGAIKHLDVKYTELCSRIDSMGETEKIKAEVHRLEKETERLLEFTDWSITDMLPFRKALDDNQAELNNLIIEADKVRVNLTKLTDNNNIDLGTYGNKKTFDNIIIADNFHIEELNGKIKETTAELSELSVIVQRLEAAPESLDLDTVRDELQKLDVRLANWNMKTVGHYIDLPAAMILIQEQYQRFLVLQEEVPTDLEIFTMEEANEIKHQNSLISKDYTKAKMKVERLATRISHIQTARDGDVACPKCEYVIRGDDSLNDHSFEVIKKEHELALQEFSVLEESKDIITKQAEALSTSLRLFNQLRDIIGLFPPSSDMWRSIGKLRDILMTPAKTIDVLVLEIKTIESLIERDSLKERKEKLEEYYYLIKLSKENNIAVKHEELENVLKEHIRTRSTIKESLNIFTSIQKQHSKLEEIVKTMENLSKERWKLTIDLINAQGAFDVTTAVKEMQLQMGTMRKSIVQWEEFVGRRDYLATETEELRKKKKYYENLLKALSPTYGLIGKQLRSSIQMFCDNVNSILEEIWEHELLIEIPKDEKKLSFNFSLIVDGAERDEVKLGSEGEQDVINLAVTLVIMAQKKLQGYPLFMDEVGRSFDYKHRKNLLEYIKRLIVTDSVSQLLMVNHFSADYGGITDSDVIVLNDSNIQIISDFNRVVKIT